MNIVVFDTETTDAEKHPFCYNVGYLIADNDTREILLEREFCVQQTWSNLQLFETAYFKQKRPIYVNRMRQRKIVLDKWGYIMQQMKRDFAAYKVEGAYAYNSTFDDRVFRYNCDWFRTQNPFDTVPIFDIWGYVSQFMVDEEYKKFCEEKKFFTKAGNYSTSAETVFRYITSDDEFEEEHTALADSRIEFEILQHCIERGAEWGKDYQVNKIVPRAEEKVLSIGYKGEEFTEYRYTKKYERNGRISLTR